MRSTRPSRRSACVSGSFLRSSAERRAVNRASTRADPSAATWIAAGFFVAAHAALAGHTVSGTLGFVAEIPEETYAQPWTLDTRNALPLVGDGRTILTAVLDWHRQTFELECAGVPPERLSGKNVPPSGLSLHGLVRHLAQVEPW